MRYNLLMRSDDTRYEIFKAAGVIIKERKLLVYKGTNKDTFVSPGGKLNPGETVKEALVRELSEEIDIKVNQQDLVEFGSYTAEAATNPGHQVTIEIFTVKSWEGEIKALEPGSEILWINSKIPTEIKVGSIFELKVIPKLKNQNLID